jgi:hypothetical protein
MKRILYLTPLIALILLGTYWRSQTAEADIFGSPLVGWWRFDTNTLVNNAADDSGNGNNGFLIAAATTTQQTAAPLAQGLTFDNAAQYVNIPDPASGVFDFASTTSFTFALWVKSSDTNSFAFAKAQAAGQPGYDLLFGSGGTAGNNLCRISDGPRTIATQATSGLNDGKWHHYVCVVDRSAQTIGIYVDSRKRGTDQNIVTVGPLANSINLQIGARNGAAFLGGSIDDARIFSKALTAAEIKTLYYHGVSQHGYGGI